MRSVRHLIPADFICGRVTPKQLIGLSRSVQCLYAKLYTKGNKHRPYVLSREEWESLFFFCETWWKPFNTRKAA